MTTVYLHGEPATEVEDITVCEDTRDGERWVVCPAPGCGRRCETIRTTVVEYYVDARQSIRTGIAPPVVGAATSRHDLEPCGHVLIQRGKTPAYWTGIRPSGHEIPEPVAQAGLYEGRHFR